MTDAIDIPLGLADDMIAHAKREHPRECCGMLVTVGGRYNAVVPMTNALEALDGYMLDPFEYAHVLQVIADHPGWDVGGFFHSHPNGDAVPSRADIAHASEDVPYLIVSLLSEPPTIRGWRIEKADWEDDDGKVTEIPMRLVVPK